ncbi:hypothetical protein PsW64_03475 [Pseudovibrio sp. W64]|uniref:FkbM family methyltransferase n=1 Tax=Pseudovibrio sp. W64 TaxID=1735583 RepID=UPI0007B292FD|nr:FkbM family methyltransferase [Pseudovibrio sp. W64]KZK77842.1 hypothetical protein PsW64_03475 [Pseudovibrio sp. W64]
MTKAKYSISSIRSMISSFDKLLRNADVEGFSKSKKDVILNEFSAIREFSEVFPKHYLKRTDAIDRIDYLRTLSTNPRTIIDVGVNKGTPKLYRAFAELPFVLIDPAFEGEERLTVKPENYTYVNKAVGDHQDTQILHDNSGKSSLLEPKGEFKIWEAHSKYEVQIDRLDTILTEVEAEPPYGVKLDVQGYELKAVRGMTKIMPKIDFLICETNIRNTAEGTYQFSELVAELLKHDFLFFNFLNNFKSNARYYDVVFLHRSNVKFNRLD